MTRFFRINYFYVVFMTEDITLRDRDIGKNRAENRALLEEFARLSGLNDFLKTIEKTSPDERYITYGFRVLNWGSHLQILEGVVGALAGLKNVIDIQRERRADDGPRDSHALHVIVDLDHKGLKPVLKERIAELTLQAGQASGRSSGRGRA